MALVLADRVKDTTTTAGTGTITLANSPPTGFQSFAAVGDGNTTYYTIAGQGTSEWEVGIGTYTSSGTTLSRDTVLSSSAGGTTKVTFSAGVKDVFVTLPSQRSYGIPFSTKSTTYTASPNEGILADTSGGPFTITLPASPVAGTQVIVGDAANTWGTNNLTLARNGSTIEGAASDLTCDITGVNVQLIYSGTTWQVFTQAGGAGGSVDINTQTTGTLTVSRGGTGAATLSANAVLLGNGTSALQTVAPGTSGNVLTSNGTTWTSTAPAGGGSWVFIASATASNSATIDFTTGIGSTYDDYVVVADNLIAGTDATALRFQMYTSGAWSTDTYYHHLINLNGGSSTITYTRGGGVTSGVIIPSLAGSGSFAYPGAFNVFFYGLNATGSQAVTKPFTSNASALTSTSGFPTASLGGGAFYDSLGSPPAAVTGIRFLMGSGNILSGNFRLYGIKKS